MKPRLSHALFLYLLQPARWRQRLRRPAWGRGAPAAGVHRYTSVEGITEYRLTTACSVLLFPDPSIAKVTVNLTVPGRLAARGLRRNGHGPPARAHGVQGHDRRIRDIQGAS